MAARLDYFKRSLWKMNCTILPFCHSATTSNLIIWNFAETNELAIQMKDSDFFS